MSTTLPRLPGLPDTSPKSNEEAPATVEELYNAEKAIENEGVSLKGLAAAMQFTGLSWTKMEQILRYLLRREKRASSTK